jgi:hypothetical protein
MNGKEYYYLNENVRMGPFALEMLRHAPIKPDTLVWNSTLPDWTEARLLPELQMFFAPANATFSTRPSPPPPPVPPPYTKQPQGGAYFGDGRYYQSPLIRPPMPDNYMIWSILSLVFCCWLISIFAIIESSKVSTLYCSGDYAGAQKASENAKKYTLWSALSIVVAVGLYLLAIFVFGVGAMITGQFVS